jgi:hypothetical protein
MFQLLQALPWKQRLLRYICGCQRYETHLGRRVKYPMFLSDFHQICGSSTDFLKDVNTNFYVNPSRGEPNFYLMTDKTNPIDAFGYFFEAA